MLNVETVLYPGTFEAVDREQMAAWSPRDVGCSARVDDEDMEIGETWKDWMDNAFRLRLGLPYVDCIFAGRVQCVLAYQMRTRLRKGGGDQGLFR